MNYPEDDTELTGREYVTIPLYDIFRTLKSMPQCPISQEITPEEKIEIFKIASLFHLRMPQKLTWDSYLELIRQAYWMIGELAMFSQGVYSPEEELMQELESEA